MITMTLIFLAGIVAGIALVLIALAGWIRSEAKHMEGGKHAARPGNARANPTANSGASPVARDGTDNGRRRHRTVARTT